MFVHNPDSPPFTEDNGSAPFDLGGDGSKTLHTPELVSSLAALAPPAFPASYSQYQESAAAPPPSLQQTTSEIIKEGLKISIRSRRASSGQPLFAEEKRSIKTELTSMDEARRQRRRERNKVAATKCRNKKKMETQHLIVDSELQVNQHNSLRLEIMQLLQERSQLMTVLTSHLPRCTCGCADSTAAALSRCRHTPPPEVPRPLSPLTPITSPDSERRPSGGSTCSWGSAGELAPEAACSLPYGGATVGGGFPCGGSVMANPAMTPSPTASVSPNYCSPTGGHGQYGMYSPGGGMPPPVGMMMSPSAPCSSSAAGTPHGSQQSPMMTPAGHPVKMGLNSPTQCQMYPMASPGYMQTPVSTPIGGGEYQYYNCAPPVAQTSHQPTYPSANAGYGPYSGYGQMC